MMTRCDYDPHHDVFDVDIGERSSAMVSCWRIICQMRNQMLRIWFFKRHLNTSQQYMKPQGKNAIQAKNECSITYDERLLDASEHNFRMIKISPTKAW